MAYTATMESFASLRAAWHDLLDRAPLNTIFFTHEWLETWWRFFGDGHELRVFSLYQEEELLGIAPLMQQGDDLRFIGSQDVCDYLDFVPKAGREGVFFHLLLSRIEPLPWRTLRLHSVRSDSPTLALLPGMARDLGWRVTVEQEDVCPRVELPESWEQYLAALDKKDRHELRRKMRRLASHPVPRTSASSRVAADQTAGLSGLPAPSTGSAPVSGSRAYFLTSPHQPDS